MIKRAFKFKKHDWQHIGWLLRNCIIQLTKGDLHEAKEALWWIRMHLTYDSTFKEN